MAWRWEEMTSPEFAAAVRETGGVCVVPIGILERHGTHLPLGTDLLVVRKIAEQAIAKEPAILFPEFFFGQVHEVKDHPGAIAIRRELLFTLLENVCEEIARNGLKKILLVNGHGGNEVYLPHFTMNMLEKPRDYTLYLARLADYYTCVNQEPTWKKMMKSEFDYHGGELETSVMMATRSGLVKMEALLPPAAGKPQKRLKHLPSVMTSVWWNADFPQQYAGDATHATPRKGKFVLDYAAAKLAAIIKAVKADTRTAEIVEDYYRDMQHGHLFPKPPRRR